MGLLADCGKAVTAYFSVTWAAASFAAGAEITLVALYFADPLVFGGLPPIVLKWHTLFTFPVVFFPTLQALLHRFSFDKWSANPIVAIVAAIIAASWRQAPLIALFLAAVTVITTVAEQHATPLRIGASAAIGFGLYHFITAAPAVGVPLALGACTAASALAIASGYQAKNEHFQGSLVRNLAFVAFEAVYRWCGPTALGAYGATAAAFVLLYAGYLMADYKWTFTRSRKVD
jgi:hypothetical protein